MKNEISHNDFVSTIRFINKICNEFQVDQQQIHIDPMGIEEEIDPCEHVFSVRVSQEQLASRNYSSEDFYSWCKKNELAGNINFERHFVVFVFTLT